VQGWGFWPPCCPYWKCIPGSEAGCGPSSPLGDALGRAKVFRPIAAGWLRGPAGRGYRMKSEGRKSLEKAREHNCLEKDYWKGKNKEARKKHQF